MRLSVCAYAFMRVPVEWGEAGGKCACAFTRRATQHAQAPRVMVLSQAKATSTDGMTCSPLGPMQLQQDGSSGHRFTLQLPSNSQRHYPCIGCRGTPARTVTIRCNEFSKASQEPHIRACHPLAHAPPAPTHTHMCAHGRQSSTTSWVTAVLAAASALPASNTASCRLCRPHHSLLRPSLPEPLSPVPRSPFQKPRTTASATPTTAAPTSSPPCTEE